VKAAAKNGKSGKLVVPRHGGGLLRVGNPGNKGGTGRPPSEIRQRCRGSFYDRIRILEEIADGVVTITIREKCPNCGHRAKKADLKGTLPDAPPTADRIRAVDRLGHYGLENDKGVSAAEVGRRLGRTIDIIRETLEPEQAEALLGALRPVWA
jgi:hypothetical protein